jgi:hypothetical protein
MFLQLSGKILLFDNFFKKPRQRFLLFLEGSLLNQCKQFLVFCRFLQAGELRYFFQMDRKGRGEGRGEERAGEWKSLSGQNCSKPVILTIYKTFIKVGS